MYNVSQAFHDAVAAGNPQKALLIFPDCVFTDEDISVENGIQFRDYFNTNEDLSIGQANSNELTFTLFNDDRLLNNYKFGDFLATLGVKIGENTYTQQGSVQVTTNNDAVYIGADAPPYLRRNGSAVSNQPNFAVKSLLAYDDKLYAFGGSGQYAVYNDKNGANITSDVSVHRYMRQKTRGWAGKGIFYNKKSRILFIYQGGIRERYEFCPLGWFVAERPNTPDVIEMDMVCYDFMTKFDIDMPSGLVSYPASIGTLLEAMCKHKPVNVKCKSTSFLNSGAMISEEPEDFESATMRDVIKWIAEAAGSNARFNRDGELEMAWLRSTGQTFDENGYSEYNPYWYETKPITKLYNRDTSGGEDNTVGGGDEGYLIQDNPLLKGVT